MSWQDRVTELIVETAAGDRFVFESGDVSRSRTDKTTIYSFPDERKDYVQKQGAGSLQFPETIFLSGADCDINAKLFEEATKDTRPLTLTYPLDDETYLVQLLDLDRADNLVTAANQVAFNVTFHETSPDALPDTTEDAPLFVDNTRVTIESINADDYAQATEQKTPEELIIAENDGLSIIQAVQTSLGALEVLNEFKAELEQILLSVVNLAETIETNAKSYASAIQGLINFPAKALATLEDKFAFFTDMIDFIDDVVDPDNAKIVLSSSIVGYADTAMQGDENDYITKSVVFDLVDTVINNGLLYFVTMDGLEIAFPKFLQNAEVSAKLADAMAAAAKNLNTIAFASKQERTERLSKPSDVYTTVYRLVGADNPANMDLNIQQFIDANNINGSELYELAEGRELKYYV